MDPVTLALNALSIGGNLFGIFGKKKQKSVDPEFLKRMFGAGAVNDELMTLFNRAMNSTQGQELMANAARSGQQFESDVARRSAEAGLGPTGGASSGADIFASAGAGQAVNNLQRGMRASMMESMLPVAQNLVQNRLSAYMAGRQPESSPWADFGNYAADWAGQALINRNTGAPQTSGTQVVANGAQQDPAMYSTGNPLIQPRTSVIPPPSLGPSPMVPQPQLMMGGTPDQQMRMAAMGRRPSRFISKMSRFSNSMGNAVQAA